MRSYVYNPDPLKRPYFFLTEYKSRRKVKVFCDWFLTKEMTEKNDHTLISNPYSNKDQALKVVETPDEIQNLFNRSWRLGDG